jgi:VWFA-related protein
MFLRFCLISSFLLLPLSSLHSQAGDKPNSPNATFQSKVRVVLLDVAVTDRGDRPIAGLQKTDFQVLEEGKPQIIASFEEHNGVPPHQAAIPPLPAHFYTNYPLNRAADSVNVLMLDALNTPLGDQSNVRAQMVTYLKKIQPGPQLAIFTLTSQMRMVEGFTADPSLLLTALNHKNWGGGPQSSPLLRTNEEDNVDQQMINAVADASGPVLTPQAQASLQAMKEFMQETKNYQTYSRVEMTLQALQQLARYLGGFPGRKNVIWFSGSFPLSILPTKGQDYDFSFSDKYKEELRKTTNMLAAAQVAIYPIAAEGLAYEQSLTASSQSILDRSQVGNDPGINAVQVAGTGLGGCSTPDCKAADERRERYASQATMDEIAKDTGGEAFYNTNGLKEALAKVISNGAQYYTISYSPTDTKMDGRYRPIEVKLLNGRYKLAYRRGYFAEDDKPVKKTDSATTNDPLEPLMGRGMPDSTQILYEIRVLPSDPQPAPQAAVAGDNAKVKLPVTRYAVDFAISTKDLALGATPDGMHQGTVEVSLVAYDHDGNTLNWLVRSIDMSLKPQLYAAFEQGGVQVHQEIDVPKGDVFLRTGIYDPKTGKAGTLEIPLNVATASATAAK